MSDRQPINRFFFPRCHTPGQTRPMSTPSNCAQIAPRASTLNHRSSPQQALLVRGMTTMTQLWHAGFVPAWDGASIQAALGGIPAPWLGYLDGSEDGHWPLGQLFPLPGSSPRSCPGLTLGAGSEEKNRHSSKGFRERKKHIKGRS